MNIITGDLVSGQIQIEVSFAPNIISLQKMAIKTGQGLVAEIVCTVTGEPMPKVTWYKGDDVRIKKTLFPFNHNWLNFEYRISVTSQFTTFPNSLSNLTTIE